MASTLFLSLAIPLSLAGAVVAQPVGTTTVTTWYGGKRAAVTLTFDDNYANQFTIGLPLLNSRGFKGTYFVVTSRVDSGVGGVTWDTVRYAASLGHEIASHSVTHPGPPSYPNWLVDLDSAQLRSELTVSRQRIDEEVPGQKCLTFAYPGSRWIPRLSDAVSPFYIGARCGHWLMESAVPTDFWHIRSFGPYTSTPVTTMNGWLDGVIANGGWFIERIHGIEGQGYEPVPASVYAQHFDYIKSREEVVWVARFADVLKYIRERQSVKIRTLSATDSIMVLEVSDNLPDDIYDAELTLQIVTPAAWNRIVVQQGNRINLLETIPRGNSNVALITALPDRGPVFIYDATASPPLAVVFAELTAQVLRGGVRVSWVTTVESNNYGFEVQRAVSASTPPLEWIVLGFVPGSGTSATTHQYSFEDRSVTPGSYRYRLRQIDTDGKSTYVGDLEVRVLSKYALYQNHPNPFNSTTVIPFDLGNEGRVVVKLFNVLGEELEVLLDSNLPAGYHEIAFSRRDLPSGLYFYGIEAGNFKDVKKLLLVK